MNKNKVPLIFKRHPFNKNLEDNPIKNYQGRLCVILRNLFDFELNKLSGILKKGCLCILKNENKNFCTYNVVVLSSTTKNQHQIKIHKMHLCLIEDFTMIDESRFNQEQQ